MLIKPRSISKLSWQWRYWYDWGGGSIKKKSPPLKNADQTQKNQTNEVANNDESDTADVMSEWEDLPKKTKMLPACTTGEQFCYSGPEDDEIQCK